jgi:hypothetical protein
LVELPRASATGLIASLARAARATPQPHILSDTFNVVFGKFQGSCFRGRTLVFMCQAFDRDLYVGTIMEALRRHEGRAVPMLPRDLMAHARKLVRPWQGGRVRLEFDLKNGGSRGNTFTKLARRISGGLAGRDVAVITDGPAQTILNRRRYPEVGSANFRVVSLPSLQNHLVFVASEMGQLYYHGRRSAISLFQLEPDLLFPGATMAAVGRHLLFEVLNPSETVRLGLELTATFTGDAANLLPPAHAIGAERVPFPVVGRGSARVFSAPFQPQQLDGSFYLAVDMGVDGQRFPSPRTGLMRLYGTQIPLDFRRLVGFARDISLVSEEQYSRLSAPGRVQRFPEDLTNRALEYSGLYEDGWLSEHSYFELSQPEDLDLLRVRGTVPRIGNTEFQCEAQLLLDGVRLADETLEPGDFVLEAKAPFRPGRRRVELRFSRYQHLPAPDRRPVAAKLHSLGF